MPQGKDQTHCLETGCKGRVVNTGRQEVTCSHVQCHVQPCTVTCSHVQSQCSPVQSRAALYSHVQSCTVTCSHVQSRAVMYSLSAALCSHVQPCTVTYSHVQSRAVSTTKHTSAPQTRYSCLVYKIIMYEFLRPNCR
jgi:hypothetical protein